MDQAAWNHIPEASSERLSKQIRFIVELDKLKRITRQTILTDRTRQENTAEHSWHIAVMALLLFEHANNQPFDLFRTVKMALIHDLVEIDAGDTYCYDQSGTEDQRLREQRAADRLFCLLPEDQAVEFRNLWEEFEARKTTEACFAGALDRLQPLLNNYATGGLSWIRNGVTSERVVSRNEPIGVGSTVLWEYARSLIEDAMEKKQLPG